MPSFSYRAVNADGAATAGVLTAENYQVALRMLEERSLFPIKVSEGSEAGALSIGGKGVKARHLTTFYSQLADLLKAGVPMLRSLDVLANQASQGTLARVVKELREDVAGGQSLGDSMSKHPRVFSPLHASMVRAGEQGGFLEDVLHRIAVFSEKQDELQNKVLGAMIYPCILCFVGACVIFLLMFFVVPKIRQYLRPETFNMLTVVTFAACDAIQEHYMAIGTGVLALALVISTLLKTQAGHHAFEVVKLRAPLIGPIMTMVAICRFCRILGTMLHNGVPILQALRISKDSAGSEILSKVIEEAADNVKKGAPLSKPLSESGLFPPAIVDMIAVAEESNNLENVLVQIADTNEARTARQIDLAVRVFEPLLLTFIAVIVACLMAALILPILTMGASVQ
jgi:general secretion pathway protein F/type IV pilus assembly protein PilC